jgi:glutathione S-transferase
MVWKYVEGSVSHFDDINLDSQLKRVKLPPSRFSLNYKNLPFQTEWVEYPEIEALCKKIGALPTGKRANGSPLYTLPVIHDPSTNTTLSESILIAEYLDKTYPDTPPLLPAGTRALQHAFADAYPSSRIPLMPFALPAAHGILNPVSQKYFRADREKTFGKTLETMTPSGAAREGPWGEVKIGFNKADGWLQRSNGPWFLGETLSFADFVVGSRLMWIRQIFGEDSPEWNEIKTWNEGRWAKFSEGLKQYEGTA